MERGVLAVADEQALQLIFRNLYDNALRYTPPGGIIRVEVVPTGPVVGVSVMYSGNGIASLALPRIFERLYRADSG